MTVKIKIGMEEIKVGLSIPDTNALLAIALGAPVVRDRKADRMVIPYPVATNFRSPAHEQWVKHLVNDSVQTKLDIQFSAKYQKNDMPRERKSRAFYFDGTYMSKNCDTHGAYVFAIAYSEKHKEKLLRTAKAFDIDIHEMIMVDYGNYFHPGYKVHGNRWLAAIIGSMLADTVYIPGTLEFWGELERTDKFYRDGSNWISRYYQRKVNIRNPNRRKKVEMKADLARFPVCKCGKCMECYTSHLITEGKIEMDPHPSLLRTIQTAVKLGKADDYIPFV